MGIFKPAWQGDNKEKALRAVEKETDLIELAEIAKNAPLDDVRVAAFEKSRQIKEVELLAKIKHATYNTIDSLGINEAFAKQSDQFLGAIAKNIQYDISVLSAAIRQINDLTVLEDVNAHYVHEAKSNTDAAFIRNKAKDRLSELKQLAYEDKLRVYLNNPENQRTSELIGNLDSLSYDKRKEAAVELIEIANTKPELIIPIWGWTKTKVEEPYKTFNVRVNEYDREEAGIYEERDSGIGLKFPTKPK